eukprot:gene8879-11976_t
MSKRSFRIPRLISGEKRNVRKKQSKLQHMLENSWDSLLEVVPCIGAVGQYRLKVFLSLFLLTSALSTFCYLFYRYYTNARTTYFLSPVKLDGNNNAQKSENCQLVPLSITGSFLASSDGYWEGSNGFQYSKAQYRLSLEGSAITVFDREFTSGSIASKNGTCKASSTALYNSATGIITLSYNYDEFMNDAACAAAAKPELLNRDILSGNPADFNIRFDVRSLVTAASINLQINSLKSLVEIKSFRQNITDSDNVIMGYYSKYYDPKYAGMSPISCYTFPNNNTFDGLLNICVVKIGEIVGLPFFNHAGTDYDYPRPCECDDSANSNNEVCNLFQFFSGFIFWDLPESIYTDDRFHNDNIQYGFSISTILQFVANSFNKRSEDGTNTRTFVFKMNQDMFNASFRSGVLRLLNAGHGGIWSDNSSFLSDSFDFCTLNLEGINFTCSMIVFSSYDLKQDVYSISNNYFQLYNGSCENKISVSPEIWNKLIKSSFTPLTQEYEKCLPDPFDAFVNGAGISQGFLDLFFPITSIAVIVIIALFQYFFAREKLTTKKRYHRKAVEEVLTRMGEKILTIHDEAFHRSQKFEIVDKNPQLKKSFVFEEMSEILMENINEDKRIDIMEDEENMKYNNNFEQNMSDINGNSEVQMSSFPDKDEYAVLDQMKENNYKLDLYKI